MTSIVEWLQSIGLEKYTALLAEQEITLEVLPYLTEADIDALGLPLGPRRRLKVEIEALCQAAKAVPKSAGKGAAQVPAVLAPALPADVAVAGAVFQPPSGVIHVAERRQLTVLFCDLVGSTALSAVMDPEELRELMQSYRKACGDVVARYDGHVAQYLGDGLMVYFGWPVAYEDSAERAVRAALEMVQAVKSLRAIKPLSVRLGVATGPVVVGESSGSENAEARLAVGEAPNLAARLQSLAGVNEVLIAPTTRRLLKRAFAVKDQGVHELKGITGLVQVWRVDGLLRREEGREASQGGKPAMELVGREDELLLLQSAWRRAVKGSGQVVAISGDPGIGKSTLSDMFRKQIAEDYTALRYQCSPYHRNSALYPFIEQLEFAAGFTREDSGEQKVAKLEALLACTPAPLPEAKALLAALLSLPVECYTPVDLPRQILKEKTFEVLIRHLESVAGEKPLLMMFEDLHWVDPTSQELLDLLIEQRLAKLPLFLMTTFRPEYVPPWNGHSGVRSIALSRLEPRSVAKLVDGITGGIPIPEEVLDEILAHTDGVPLFVEELTKSVLESGQLRRVGDRFELTAPMRSLTIPTTLRDSLSARLDRLAPVKEIAQVGACIGREFSHELLSRVAGISEERLEYALTSLLEAGLISRRGMPPHAVYVFKHALVQDAAYDLLLKSRRREWHAQIARALEDAFADDVAQHPELLAHHYTQADHLSEALPLWSKAGTRALERVALQEAVAHFQKVLDLNAELPLSVERDALELRTREQLNGAWAGLRGWAAAEVGANTQEILRLAEAQKNQQKLIIGLWWMWSNTITQGRIAASLPWAQRLMEEAEVAEDVDLRLFGPAATMVSNFFLGRLEVALAQAERVLALYDPQRADRWIRLAGQDLRTMVEVWACQCIWIQGYPDRALQVSEEGKKHAQALGNTFNWVWALTFGAYAFAFRREPKPLMERVEAADRVAREQGLTFIYQVSVPQILGLARLHEGKPQEAAHELEQSIKRWTSLGGNVRVPYLKSALAQAVAEQGDLERARELVEECLEQIERPEFQERIWLSEVHRVKGWILSQQGDLTAAEAELREAVAVAREQGAKSWELRSAITLAEVLRVRGDAASARAVLEPVQAWFTEGWATPDLVESVALLEALTAD